MHNSRFLRPVWDKTSGSWSNFNFQCLTIILYKKLGICFGIFDPHVLVRNLARKIPGHVSLKNWSSDCLVGPSDSEVLGGENRGKSWNWIVGFRLRGQYTRKVRIDQSTNNSWFVGWDYQIGGMDWLRLSQAFCFFLHVPTLSTTEGKSVWYTAMILLVLSSWSFLPSYPETT